MGLEDFEKELAATKPSSSSSSSRMRHRSRSRSRDRHSDSPRDEKRRHRHSHHSHHHHHHHRDDDHHRHRSHRDDRSASHSRSHRHPDHDRRKHERRERDRGTKDVVEDDDGEEAWVEKEAMTAPPTESILDELDLPQSTNSQPRRDTWMEAPSSLDIDYVQRSKSKPEPPSQFVPAKEQHERKIHEQEMKHLLKDLQEEDDDDDEEKQESDAPYQQHQVSYKFGDSGSDWRMTKLRAVYRKADESALPVERVALVTYGELSYFDDAREEEQELERRAIYGKDYNGHETPTGDFFRERLQKAKDEELKSASAIRARREEEQAGQASAVSDGQVIPQPPPPARTIPLDQTALNKLKAQMMKAKLRKAPNAAQLEAEYEVAAAANSVQPDVVVLDPTQNRMLAGGREGEVNRIENKRGRERGLVEENEDMSIEDMVRQEKRTRNQRQGEGRAFAERIAKDGKFDDNLDYMDENAAKLARNMAKSDINLRNTAIGDFHKMQRILDTCPLCHHEDTNTPPAAPVVALATRVYMTLPTEPEIAPGGAVIVPMQHHLNLLECDDDEWEEIRNFMKSLTRMYHQKDKGVIFYENAAHMHSRKGHAALFAIPLPFHLADDAPAYFKEAVLGADEEWSQHKKIIDTLAKSQQPGFGKQAFRKSLVKEMPYFHVWFTMDGGLGHVIEDERRWPKGDLFAREIVGGMLGKGPDVIKKQGRWTRQDSRVEGFRKRWNPFDWTRVLYDNQ
ncbi:hypothetical protein AAFC00_005590 [Neodothiora populina]|uniref:Cell cycle control protein cwf19 n=1 Tax=Neodothiora populina TaxID=2781224 RepID=A0ABR3PLJ7_9PEZI